MRWLIGMMGLAGCGGIEGPAHVAYFDTQAISLELETGESTPPSETDTVLPEETEAPADTEVELDETGCVAEVGIDIGRDGATDARERHTYDDNARLVRLETYAGDGSLTSETATTWGDHGPELVEEDIDGDGVVDSITTSVWDSSGRLDTVEEDTDADGSADITSVYSYADATTELPATRVWTGDESGTDTYEWTEDVGGDHLELSRDLGSDGIADSAVTAEWDVVHGLAFWLEDHDLDGSYESIETFTYDDALNLLTKTRTRAYEDEEQTGQEDVVITRSASGWILTLDTFGFNAEGSYEQRDTYAWECGE